MTVTLPAFASQSVVLAWSASKSPGIMGYHVYCSTCTGNYTNEISAGNVTNLIVPGLVDGTTYSFVVRAVNSSGVESGNSAQVSYSVPTAAAIMGRPVISSNAVSFPVIGVPGYLYVVQTSTDMVNWVSMETNFTPLQFTDQNAGQCKRKFYRAAYFH